MEPIQQNPFHILGITADASQRTIAKRKAKINAFQKVEKEIVFDDDLILGNKPDRSAESINKALNEADKNESKVRYALFWFVNYNHLDNTALGYLKDGDLNKAQEIWEKVTSGKPVSAKNFSVHNNQGTLNLYLSAQSSFTDKELLKNGVALKTELILSDFFEQFVQLIADETYTIDAEQALEAFTGALLTEFKNFDNEQGLITTLSEAHPEIEQVVAQKITQKPLNDLEWKIKETKQQRNKYPEKGLNLGANLYEKNIDNLEVLNEHLGQKNLQYKSLRDKLANEILQCGVNYFKQYEEDEDLHEEKVQQNGQFREFNFDGDLGNDVMQLFQKADVIAVGDQVKDRIAENKSGLESWMRHNVVEEEVSFIENTLKNFKDSEASISNAENLINTCLPKIKSLKEYLGEEDSYYLNISSTVLSIAQGMVVEAVNESKKLYESGNMRIESLDKKIQDSLDVLNLIEGLDATFAFAYNNIDKKQSLISLKIKTEEIINKKKRKEQNEKHWGIAALIIVLIIVVGQCAN